MSACRPLPIDADPEAEGHQKERLPTESTPADHGHDDRDGKPYPVNWPASVPHSHILLHHGTQGQGVAHVGPNDPGIAARNIA